MHTVIKNNTGKAKKRLDNDVKPSYTSILNSAIDSTLQKKNIVTKIDRFFYSVGDYNFLFEEDLKLENIPQKTINQVPHAPEWCLGIISVRNEIMPVVDMHIILRDELKQKLDKDYSKNFCLLMIKHEHHMPIIIKVDKLPRVANIKEYNPLIVEENSPKWLGKAWENSTNKLYEVDHNKLFNTLRSIL